MDSEATATLSARGEAIRTYKSRANQDGAAAWSAVPSSSDIRMHVPKFNLEAEGPAEIDAKVFGLMASAGLRQELVEISEHGPYVTCFLRITDGNDAWDSVEVFLFDENDQVAEIWAL